MKRSSQSKRRIDRYEKRIDALFWQMLHRSERDSAWRVIHTLRRTGHRLVLDKAVNWTHASSPLRRMRGADVLAQIGKTIKHHEHSFPSEAFEAISRLIKTETFPEVLNSALTAFGHIGDERGVQLLLMFAHHSDSNVRFACSFSLGSFAKHEAASAGLLELMEDADSDVRDWATFGVAQFGLDTEDVHEALLNRLQDNDEDTWEEAACGLAKRGDQRVIDPLIQALERAERRGRYHPRLRDAATYLLTGDDVPELELTEREFVDRLRALS